MFLLELGQVPDLPELEDDQRAEQLAVEGFRREAAKASRALGVRLIRIA
jgi:hypothetical protein